MAICALLSDEVHVHALQINPVAVYGILDTLQVPTGKYLLQSAAGSAFGRMLISLAKVSGVQAAGVPDNSGISRRSASQWPTSQLC
jgi:NADPH-dependent curcumin reductase CurA